MNIFEKTISDLMKTINRLYGRLEVDISGIGCREVLVHNKRIDIIKRNIEKLRDEERVVRDRYLKCERSLYLNKQVIGRVVKTSFALIVILSLFVSIYAVEAILGIQIVSSILPGFVSREYLPIVASASGILIGVLSIVFSASYRIYHRRSTVLSKEYSLLKNKHRELINRIQILEREYEKSYRYRIMPYEFNICRCYTEFTEFREKMWLITRLISELRSCSSNEFYNHYLGELIKSINEFKNISSVCDTVFSNEYSVFIETLCNSDENSILNNCCIKITIRGKEYLLDISSYLSKSIIK